MVNDLGKQAHNIVFLETRPDEKKGTASKHLSKCPAEVPFSIRCLNILLMPDDYLFDKSM